MKKGLMALGLAVLVVVSMTAFRHADEPKYKYLIARIPMTAVNVEFDGNGKGARLKPGAVSPLDTLGREGWDLVSTVPDGTTVVCFLRAPADAK